MSQREHKLTRRSFIELLGATGAVAVTSAFAVGCSKQEPAPAPTDKKTETSEHPKPAANSKNPFAGEAIVDAKGHEFIIPDKIDRIAITCNGGTTHEVCIFGAADKIVAQPPQRFPQLHKMYPNLKDVMNAGSFDDLNMEAMVAAEPDIALVGYHSDKGNAQIRDVGIPSYTMLIGWAAVDTLKQEFLNLGKMLNNEQKAKDLVAFWDKTIAAVEERANKIPENERLKVLYLSKGDVTKVNKGSWGRTWVDTAGGVFAIPDELQGEISVEQALEWNPDIIVTHAGSSVQPLYDDEKIVDMKAIKNKRCYETPQGGFWWDRPSPESVLAFYWLGQVMYPDYFGDIDLKKETKAFYKEFYNYDLSDEEYEAFFEASKNKKEEKKDEKKEDKK